MNGIGLAGCHRTGKTTLAKAYSERHGIPYVETHVASAYKQMGYDVKTDYPIKTRLAIQWQVLTSLLESYSSAKGRSFITDRTPIDLLAYTLADAGRQNLDETDNKSLSLYHKACVAATNKYFGIVVIVQPGIKIVDLDNKGPTNFGYMEHISTLILGLSMLEDLTPQFSYIPRHVLSLDRRVGAINQSIDMSHRSFQKFSEKKGGVFFSESIH